MSSGKQVIVWNCPQCGVTNPTGSSTCSGCGAAGLHQTPPTRDHGRWRSGPARSAKSARVGSSSPATDWRQQLYAGAAASSLMVWLYLMFEYRKWDAAWSIYPVWLVGLAVASLMAFELRQRGWFRHSGKSMAPRTVFILLVAFILCAYLGIYCTEPYERGGSLTRIDVSGEQFGASIDRSNPAYQYDYSFARAYGWRISRYFDFAGNVGMVDNEPDDEGSFIALILFLVLLIIGSLIVPHFWVVSTFLMVFLLSMVAYREWRLTHPGNIRNALPKIGL